MLFAIYKKLKNKYYYELRGKNRIKVIGVNHKLILRENYKPLEILLLITHQKNLQVFLNIFFSHLHILSY